MVNVETFLDKWSYYDEICEYENVYEIYLEDGLLAIKYTDMNDGREYQAYDVAHVGNTIYFKLYIKESHRIAKYTFTYQANDTLILDYQYYYSCLFLPVLNDINSPWCGIWEAFDDDIDHNQIQIKKKNNNIQIYVDERFVYPQDDDEDAVLIQKSHDRLVFEFRLGEYELLMLEKGLIEANFNSKPFVMDELLFRVRNKT